MTTSASRGTVCAPSLYDREVGKQTWGAQAHMGLWCIQSARYTWARGVYSRRGSATRRATLLWRQPSGMLTVCPEAARRATQRPMSLSAQQPSWQRLSRLRHHAVLFAPNVFYGSQDVYTQGGLTSCSTSPHSLHHMPPRMWCPLLHTCAPTPWCWTGCLRGRAPVASCYCVLQTRHGCSASCTRSHGWRA